MTKVKNQYNFLDQPVLPFIEKNIIPSHLLCLNFLDK